jgi:uncharacterized protein (DUF58 family)
MAHFLPKSWRLPLPGFCWLLITAMLLTVGLSRNINLLTLLGFAVLAVFALNALAASRRLGRLRARREIVEPVFAGLPCAVEIRLTVQGTGPAGPIRIEDRGPSHSLLWLVSGLTRTTGQTVRGEIVLPERGRYAWGPLEAVSSYPFGLIAKRETLAPGQEIIVFPQLGRLHRGLLRRRIRSAAGPGERVRRPGLRHRAAQDELHGLRPFRPGDSPRAIHWRTSARRGELLVREFEDLPGDDLAVVFDPAGTSHWRFEAALSLTATICWEWCRHKGDRLALVMPGPDATILDGRTGPDHGRRLLERLAVAQRVSNDKAEALPERFATVARAAAVLLISSAPARLAEEIRRHVSAPVTCLDVTYLDDFDFYSPAP